MTTDNPVAAFLKGDSSTRVKAIGIFLAVSAVGYGIAQIAEQSNPRENAALASVREDRTLRSEPLPATRNEPSATDESQRPAALGERISEPRECAPEKGITDACIY